MFFQKTAISVIRLAKANIIVYNQKYNNKYKMCNSFDRAERRECKIWSQDQNN